MASSLYEPANLVDVKGSGLSTSKGVWDAPARARIRAQLDACFFTMYGLEAGDVEYVLTTFESLHRQEVSELGYFRTAELVLEAMKERPWTQSPTS